MGRISTGVGGGGCGASRDWVQMYAIYGADELQTVLFLTFHAALFATASVLLFVYFDSFVFCLHSAVLPAAPLAFLCSAAALAGSVAALTSGCLLYAAVSILKSSLTLRWEMALRMVAAVPDWSTVRTALDLGCGRGILLNAVALQLKKQGACGRIVGLDRRREVAVAALRRAGAEGVQEYVTCREGDARSLPFPDASFDVVVSAVHLSTLGRPPAASQERARALGEVVRVLKPGGVGVLWDLVCVPEMTQRLKEMRMDDVKMSERITAYMVNSHIVSFRKPIFSDASPPPPPLQPPVDWRAIIC